MIPSPNPTLVGGPVVGVKWFSQNTLAYFHDQVTHFMSTFVRPINFVEFPGAINKPTMQLRQSSLQDQIQAVRFLEAVLPMCDCERVMKNFLDRLVQILILLITPSLDEDQGW